MSREDGGEGKEIHTHKTRLPSLLFAGLLLGVQFAVADNPRVLQHILQLHPALGVLDQELRKKQKKKETEKKDEVSSSCSNE